MERGLVGVLMGWGEMVGLVEMFHFDICTEHLVKQDRA